MPSFESAPSGFSPIDSAPDAEDTINEIAQPEAGKKKEKFEEFDLRPGDRIVYDTRKDSEKATVEPTKDCYEVRSIVEGEEKDSGVFLLKYEHQEKDGRMVPKGDAKKVPFSWVVKEQGKFLSIDQPRLPEGKTLRDYAAGGRLKIILDGIEGKADGTESENAGTLKDPNLLDSERARLMVAKANLVRQIMVGLKKA
jgi:hypothetical protein